MKLVEHAIPLKRMPEFPKLAVPMSKFDQHMGSIEPLIRELERVKKRDERPIFYAESAQNPIVRPDDKRYPVHFAAATKAVESAMDFAKMQHDHFQGVYEQNKQDVKTLKKSLGGLPFSKRLQCYGYIYSPRVLWNTLKMRMSIRRIGQDHDRLLQTYTYLQGKGPKRK